MGENIQKLAELFARFPGIGERQAKRFVYYLLSAGPTWRKNLASEISSIGLNVIQCEKCTRFFDGTKKNKICHICANPSADPATLLVVEKDSDLEAIARSGTYKGGYFVLGALVRLPDENTKNLRLDNLLKRIQKDLDNGLEEIILAFPAHVHGEYTDAYLRKSLTNAGINIKVTTLGRGLSTGSEIEYADAETLKNALSGRG